MIASVVDDDSASADIGKERLAAARFMIDRRLGRRCGSRAGARPRPGPGRRRNR